MKVHFFGAKSFPSCASFCLRETSREFGKFFDPQIAEIVFKNFYVDDCLVSVNSVESAIQVVKDLRCLLSRGGFRVTKWLSSNKEVMRTSPDEDNPNPLKISFLRLLCGNVCLAYTGMFQRTNFSAR